MTMRIMPSFSEPKSINNEPVRDFSEARRSSFADALKDKFMEVNELQHRADQAMKQGAVAGAENIHETMIQLEEADISMRLMLKVRDKALSAYQEIMRMQF